MIEGLLDLPSHLRERLASALDAGMLGAPYSAAALRATVGSVEQIEPLVAALSEFERLGVAGPAAAAWIRSLQRAATRTRR